MTLIDFFSFVSGITYARMHPEDDGLRVHLYWGSVAFEGHVPLADRTEQQVSESLETIVQSLQLAHDQAA